MKSERILLNVLLVCIFSFAFPVLAQGEDASGQAAEAYSFLDALVGGQVKAMFRYSGQYRNSNLHLLQDSSSPEAPDEKVQQYSAVGGFWGYQTAPWLHTSFGATVYTAVPFGNNPADRRGLGSLYEEDGEQDAYAGGLSFFGNYNFEAYKEIHGYDFESVT